jgi:hypothetical protein
MHFDVLFEDEMERIVLAFLKQMANFLTVFASCNVKYKLLLGEGVSFVEWARRHLLNFVH